MNNQQLQAEMDRLYTDEEGKKPMYDGILNEEKYQQAKVKILWVCKEPYDLGDGKGGWSLTDDMNNNVTTYFEYKVIRRIALSSYCILNNCGYADALGKDDVATALQSVAYINLNKIPAGTNSSGRDSYLAKVYNKCKSVLLQQIESYNPDILFFGNVFNLFMVDLGLTWAEGKNLEYQMKSIFYKNDKLFIDSYHPSVRHISEENFCMSIYETAAKWQQQRINNV